MPGLRGHVDDHWQTRLAAKLPDAVVVPSFGRDKRDLAGRVADLHRVIHDAEAPVTIVAHSAGCADDRAVGAPSTTCRSGGAPGDAPGPGPAAARPVPHASRARVRLAAGAPSRLPFPGIVAASTNDALGDFENVRSLAGAWGSHFIDVGPVGHLNPASGHGERPGPKPSSTS